MGTRQTDTVTQTVAKIAKPPKCSICREVIKPDCTWQQGRCPHIPSLLDEIMNDNYKSRFYNLIKFFKRK
jgi:hypothetical protein